MHPYCNSFKNGRRIAFGYVIVCRVSSVFRKLIKTFKTLTQIKMYFPCRYFFVTALWKNDFKLKFFGQVQLGQKLRTLQSFYFRSEALGFRETARTISLTGWGLYTFTNETKRIESDFPFVVTSLASRGKTRDGELRARKAVEISASMSPPCFGWSRSKRNSRTLSLYLDRSWSSRQHSQWDSSHEKSAFLFTN